MGVHLMFRIVLSVLLISGGLSRAQEPAKKVDATVLEQICRKAISKDEIALADLKRDYPALHKHVVTLIVDKEPYAVAGAIQEIQKLGSTARGAWPVIDHAMTRLNLE